MDHFDPSQIDPTMLKNALAIGAALAPTAKEVALDLYHGLRDRVKKAFVGHPEAEQALAKYEEQPDVEEHKGRLAQELIRLGIAQDPELVNAANQVRALIDARQLTQNKMDVRFGENAQGNAVGPSAQINANYFGVPPQPAKEPKPNMES